jgi:TonB family protein
MIRISFLILSIIYFSDGFGQDEIKAQNNDLIFMVVEEMPILTKECLALKEDKDICSNRAIADYLSNFSLPEEYHLEGKVYIKFIVDVDGSVIDAEVVRGVNEPVDNLAIEYIMEMPKFARPGMQRGTKVKIQFVVPINLSVN